ncbi:hypothetical protein M2459_001735 [Parabacteroides sp. PF5-5]|uniref:LytR/AlgR family response regulator transcription factor n=1 Tax=unclassified Parabacteroides TaxID=2649774 RepID=UPI002475336F|nr:MULTISPECIES: LytTR family DNA-binding domain-containing protein [unclassified Parabacteroides]MDH6304998.1 hypothetical protein [Parabacteroides sp. PH5-39]MDH6315917.1 hypothetical protein [Parabacteroides sp. PF5-13]MDH6319574.1 hypothetical protein [Parabacteroides sp. PH5-13]MDH6323305.1 hypothetical protein [Parabacteroides sp. PH5-8]MDH6327187.1 hypothetical protein [Parabacteroides sp. PH5-41]
MQEHPFTTSLESKLAGSILILLAMVVQWGLLVMYAGYSPSPAVVDSILSITLLALAGYAGWYMLAFVKVWQAQIVVALLVQAFCLGVTYSVLSLSDLATQEAFIKSLPLRFFFGLLCWIILLQWYTIQGKEEPEPFEPIKQEEVPQTEAKELIDRISVKDGGRIHIIQINQLFYLQASGDYVTLFADSGQFIKEQTMKHFELHLPPTFVRIHRSTIINTNYIVRVELFGKESYQVKLKDGTSLKASSNGYKLLKEKLNL